jgi:hypothetical protein
MLNSRRVRANFVRSNDPVSSRSSDRITRPAKSANVGPGPVSFEVVYSRAYTIVF